MPDQLRKTDRPSDRNHEHANRMPRWVWWIGLIIGVAILLFLVMQVIGGGFGGHVPPPHNFSFDSGGPDAEAGAAREHRA